jgi:hypothetical protein
MRPIIAKEIYPLYKEAREWLVQRREEYRKECDYYYKQGFRPQHCIHGVNMWVDYDCACWQCEVDNSDIQIARDMAVSEYVRRLQKVAIDELLGLSQ